MTKEDLEVTLADGTIKIAGEKKKEKEIKKEDYHMWVHSCDSFYRKLSLPAKTQTDKVKSTFYFSS
jgi:HSP20 family protein